MKYYRINETLLRDLLIASHKYCALESWGVDNWEVWGEAQINYINDCCVIDETEYEDIEAIAEADLQSFQTCYCKDKGEIEKNETTDCLYTVCDNDFDFMRV